MQSVILNPETSKTRAKIMKNWQRRIQSFPEQINKQLCLLAAKARKRIFVISGRLTEEAK